MLTNLFGRQPFQSRRSSSSTISLTIFCAIGILLLLQNANCEQTNPTSKATAEVAPAPAAAVSVSTSTSSSVSISASSKPSKHKKYVVVAEKVVNPPGWNGWLPMPNETIAPELLPPPMPNTTPLTVAEQEKRVANHFQSKKKQEIEQQITKDKQKYNYQSQKKPSSGGGGGFDKWSLDSIRDQAFTYTQMLLDNFMNGVQSTQQQQGKGKPKAKPHQGKSAAAPPPMDQMTSASSHYNGAVPAPPPPPPASFAGGFSAASGLFSSFGGEGKSVVNWLARLIGVSGKTLGEFLREYQVHVLYDLVFTFFKWIFFLYAGLLIP